MTKFRAALREEERARDIKSESVKCLKGDDSIVLLAELLKLGRVGTAKVFLHLLAVLVELEGGHGLDAARLRDVSGLVDIHLAEDDVRVGGGELFEFGLDHVAGGAPRGEEVHDDDFARVVREHGVKLSLVGDQGGHGDSLLAENRL